MNVSILSANLGNYEKVAPSWPELEVPPGVEVSVHRFTDETFPPRPLAMTSRLQCGILKWYGWQFAPEADVLIWIDASCAPTPIAVSWFLRRLDVADIAVFRHPERNTIREEYEFVVARMARPGERYLTSRYRGEWLAEQVRDIEADVTYRDDRLYASTAFVYRPTEWVEAAFQDMWIAKTRWCLHDQLYFPYALWKAGCMVRVIEQSYLRCPALEYMRGRRS